MRWSNNPRSRINELQRHLTPEERRRYRNNSLKGGGLLGLTAGLGIVAFQYGISDGRYLFAMLFLIPAICSAIGAQILNARTLEELLNTEWAKSQDYTQEDFEWRKLWKRRNE